MKKILYPLLIILALCSCSNTNDSSISNHTNKEKPITGIDPIFNEELGYYNMSPSALKISDSEMYVYYTRNENIYTENSDSIAVRHATLVDNKWNYSDFKTILRLPNDENAWDSKYISSPDVIKGIFSYNGKTYNYLMAYAGSIVSGRMNSQIGFAVSNYPDGEFIRVGNEPIISYDSSSHSASGLKRYKGVQEPSLVSYNKKGKIQLFYSYYATYNASYCVEMDCSNLNSIIKGGAMVNQISGLFDETTNTHLYSADWAYDPVNDEYIVCRNYSSSTTGQPSVASAVQLVYAKSKAFSEVNYEYDQDKVEPVWNLVNQKYSKIGAIKTADEYSDNEMKWSGYYRVYNGCVISNAYGWLDNTNKIEILFTSNALDNSKYLKDDEYKYSSMIHYYAVDFIKEEI